MPARPLLEYHIQALKQAAKYYATARTLLVAELRHAEDTDYDADIFYGFDDIHASWVSPAHSWQIVTEDGTRRLADNAYPEDIGPILGEVGGDYYAHFPKPATVAIPADVAEQVIRATERAETQQEKAEDRWDDVASEHQDVLEGLGYEFEE